MPLNRQQRRVLGNGMAVSTIYDQAGRITAIQNQTSTGTALAMFTHTYDAVGNRLTASEIGALVTYAYDLTYQLTNEQRSGANAYNTTYTYDGLGNRLTKADQTAGVTTYSYNSANEQILQTLPSGALTTQTYDANGNLILENAAGALTTTTWDFENRISNLYYAGAYSDSFNYEADGKRLTQGLNSTGELDMLVWDEQNLLLKSNFSTGVTQQKMTYSSPGSWGSGGDLISVNNAGTPSFYLGDASANVRALVSSAQAITDTYIYKAFVEELAMSGSTVNVLKGVGMLGIQRDAATALFMRARRYRSDLGRFNTVDPLGFLGGDWNLYRYVGNNPVVFLDPNGLLYIPIPFANCSAADYETCWAKLEPFKKIDWVCEILDCEVCWDTEEHCMEVTVCDVHCAPIYKPPRGPVPKTPPKPGWPGPGPKPPGWPPKGPAPWPWPPGTGPKPHFRV